MATHTQTPGPYRETIITRALIISMNNLAYFPCQRLRDGLRGEENI